MTSTEASSVAIMLHERDADAQMRNDRIWPIAENWRRSGIDVRVVCGPRPCTDSDVLVQRLDCSYIPDPYWRIIQNHPRAVNARVRDIRKTAISYQLARDDPLDGPVIVQSLNNIGGCMDVKFGGTTPPSRWDELLKRAAWHPWIAPRPLGWTRTQTEYPTFTRIRDAAIAAWRNRHLVFEGSWFPIAMRTAMKCSIAGLSSAVGASADRCISQILTSRVRQVCWRVISHPLRASSKIRGRSDSITGKLTTYCTAAKLSCSTSTGHSPSAKMRSVRHM